MSFAGMPLGSFNGRRNHSDTLGSICHRFVDHWTRVNAALLALNLAPLTLGAFTLAQLQAAQATLQAKNTAIESLVEGT